MLAMFGWTFRKQIKAMVVLTKTRVEKVIPASTRVQMLIGKLKATKESYSGKYKDVNEAIKLSENQINKSRDSLPIGSELIATTSSCHKMQPHNIYNGYDGD